MWKVAVNARDLPYQQALSLPLDNPNRVIDITDLLAPKEQSPLGARRPRNNNHPQATLRPQSHLGNDLKTKIFILRFD